MIVDCKRTDGLAFVGSLYGRLLIDAKQPAEATEVLLASAAAYRALNNDQRAREIDAIVKEIANWRKAKLN